MHYEILEELGFTKREVKVYVALLELGSSTAGPIAVKADLPQTKVYETLGKLIQKGLVSYTIISKTKHFQAQNPKSVLNIIDQKKQEYLKILDELELKQKFSQQRQVANVYEGYKAVRLLFEDEVNALQKNDFYYAFAFKFDYKETSVPLFFAQIHNKLAEKKVPDLVIANAVVNKEITKTFSQNKNIKVRFSDQQYPLGLVITKHKVIQALWGDLPTAIVIESKQIVEQYKTFFEQEWKKAKK